MQKGSEQVWWLTDGLAVGLRWTEVNYRRGRASVPQGWALGARGQLPD